MTSSRGQPPARLRNPTNGGELARSIGAEVLRVGVVDDAGALCAAMLVFITEVPVLHRPFLYAPRDPIINDPDSPAMTALLDFVRVQARRHGAFLLKVEPGVEHDNRCWLTALRRRGFRANPYPLHVRSEWVLDIRPDEQALLANMQAKWRYNVRLAARKGVSVRGGEGPTDLESFYRLYQQTSERERFFIHSMDHYHAIMRLYGAGDRAALLLAEYEGEVLAGMIVLRFGQWSWYMYGASSEEKRQAMPNHLLQWSAIQWAKSHGCRYYNFRGIPEGLEEGRDLWGVYVFKRGFGGYATRSLESHDLVYQPLTYAVYRRLLDLKQWRH